MHNPLGYLGIDQYGDKYILKSQYPRKELLEYFGRKHASKMYTDLKSGGHKESGYVIAGHWITLYRVFEWKEGKING